MSVRSIGMLFSDAMVQAILEDRKDVTRRAVSPQPWANGSIAGETAWFWKHGKPATEVDADYIHTNESAARRWMQDLAPWEAGDVIWVRECAKLCAIGPGPRDVSVTYRATEAWGNAHNAPQLITYPEGEPNPYGLTRWTPGIHMPRWASRIRLQVMLVRVERLHEMTDGSATREGILPVERVSGVVRYAHAKTAPQAYFSPLNAYQALWDSLNGERKAVAWRKNPFVYAVTFRRLKEER